MFTSRWADRLEEEIFYEEDLSHQGPLQNDGIYGIVHKFQL